MTTLRFEFECETSNDRNADLSALITAEGHLTIFFENKIVFDEANVLLGEFAICAEAWLRKADKDGLLSFRYSSMDYEEEVILQTIPKDGMLALRSPWFNTEHNRDVQIFPEEFFVALKNFVNAYFAEVPELKRLCPVLSSDL
ncbi:hypothetical protein ACQU0X_15805 [Pseudovibrio ascidiaceicola]|uniref:DUF7878 domain-containing protein n=1 Tax=Pseudovibrio ascidiaceicola TaxID=285279 RepID=UPI003D36C1E0